MQAKLFRHGGRLTINITAHPATFKKWWDKVCESFATCTLAKAVNCRRAFGVYLIDGEYDAVETLWQRTLLR